MAGLFALPAQAQITLSLSPSAQSILVGQSAHVDLQISGLDSITDPNLLDSIAAGLGGWHVEIDYNQLILSTPSVSFTSSFSSSVQGSGTGGPPFYFWADETADPGSTLLTGNGTYTLAKFSFIGLTQGTTLVDWALDPDQVQWNSLTDGYGTSLTFDNGAPVRITVQAPSNGVPDTPVTLPLIAVIGLLLAFRRHGRRAA